MNIFEELIKDDLIIKQQLSLENKIEYTKIKIKEFVDKIGLDNCFISFSGGRDSSVLLHIVRSMYPSMKAIFFDTYLEYPEMYDFINTIENVETIKPKKTVKQVFSEYGVPVISKEQSSYINDVRETESDKTLKKRLNYPKSYSIEKKWIHFTDKEMTPYKISNKCCDYFKKKPCEDYIKDNHKYPILGTRADESLLRMNSWIKYSCNRFEGKIQSNPLSIWTIEDIKEYISLYDVSICVLYNMGHERTGCYLCPFGSHIDDFEKGHNKFELLYDQHPKHYKSLYHLGMIEALIDTGIKIRQDKEYMKKFYERELRINRWYKRIEHSIKEDGKYSEYYKYYNYFKGGKK